MNDIQRVKIDRLATDVFESRADFIGKDEFEFAIGLYRKIDGSIVFGKPIIGDEAEVKFELESRLGALLAVVHSHPDGSVDASPWDDEFGERVVKETGELFLLYTIGYDENGNLIMCFSEYGEVNECV